MICTGSSRGMPRSRWMQGPEVQIQEVPRSRGTDDQGVVKLLRRPFLWHCRHARTLPEREVPASIAAEDRCAVPSPAELCLVAGSSRGMSASCQGARMFADGFVGLCLDSGARAEKEVACLRLMKNLRIWWLVS